jgi:rubrerythrin
MRPVVTIASASTFAFVLIIALTAASKASASITLENLQVVYNGESNAHERYLAFAKQAESEGYGEVASLFRAAARAEKIHAMNHAAVIEELGAVPSAKIEEPGLKSTRENLEAAVKGETYERDEMYPNFLKQARADRNSRAVRTLNLAKTAEAEHARLYSEMLASLDRLKGTKATAFYVCPVCGYTVRETNFAKCPSCFTSKEKFEKVA